MTTPSSFRQELSKPNISAAASLAPSGRLRAAINFGNSVLVQRRSTDAVAQGVSILLAQELARRLDVPLDLIEFDGAGKVFASLADDVWDLAFLAIQPERAREVAFTEPYVWIDGAYLVAVDAPFNVPADVDRQDVTITVGQGAAYDLFLSRELKHAQLYRLPTSASAIETFLERVHQPEGSRHWAAAGIRPALNASAQGRLGLRVLTQPFSRVEQAMAIPQGRELGLTYLQAFISEMKLTGFVRRALDETGQANIAVPDQ